MSRHGSLPWRILICLAVCALALRAAIPGGFMAAPSSSPLALALCTAAGPGIVKLDLPGKAGDVHAADHCVFGAVASHAVLPDAGLAPRLGARPAHAAPARAAYRAAPALPPLGPPLGPRAPPVPLA